MNSDDFLPKFEDLAKRFKDEFNAIIEGERVKKNAEVKSINKEEKHMQAVAVKSDDIIYLNVGGQKFTTHKSTLCLVQGSMLAIMFSGRWKDCVKPDRDGCICFDYDPRCFAFILEYLRAKKIATCCPPPLPIVPDDLGEKFRKLVDYLGLSDAFVLREKFNLHSSRVDLEEDGAVAVHDKTKAFQYVLGENVYQQGIVNLKLRLASFESNHWIFIGIVEAGVVPPDNYSFRWPGAYGWEIGSAGYQGTRKEGSKTRDNRLVGLIKQGNELTVTIDFDAAKLSLYLTTNHCFHIDIPKNKTWRLNINLLSPYDKIRIVNE